jgi:hypothetical protein
MGHTDDSSSYVASRIYLHNPPGGKKRATTVSHFEEGEAVPMHDVGPAMTPSVLPAQYFDQKQHMSGTPMTYSSTTNLLYRDEDRERATSMLEREQGDGEEHGGHGGHEHKPEIGPWPALVLLLVSVGMITITAECVSFPSWVEV